MEEGFHIGRRNRRGITTRLPRDGGEQERVLAGQYRDWSRATSLEWPRVSALLEEMAQGYEHDAQGHDDDAELLDWQ